MTKCTIILILYINMYSKLPLWNGQWRHLLATFSNVCLECDII